MKFRGDVVGENQEKKLASQIKTGRLNKQNKVITGIKILIVGVVFVCASIALLAVIKTNKTNHYDGAPSASKNSKMILETNRQTVKIGDEFTVKIYSDSTSVDVNAVQVAIVYDSKLIELKKIDSTKSNYPIQAHESHNSDIVEIARGAINGINEKKIVSEMQFIAKSPGEATINFKEDETLLLDEKTSKNILHNGSFNSITIGVN